MKFIEDINTRIDDKRRQVVNSILEDKKFITDLKRVYGITIKPLETLMLKYNYITSVEQRREMAKRDREEAAVSMNILIKNKLVDIKVWPIISKQVSDDILKRISELIGNEQKKSEISDLSR